MSIFATIKTYALVTLVAALIWVWAEAESLTTVQVSPKIEFTFDGGDAVATVIDAGWNGLVRVNVKGASAAVSRAQLVLASTVRLLPGVGSVPAAPGEHMVDLRQALRDHPELSRLGVNYLDVEPSSVRVRVEPLAQREIPVKAILPGLDLDAQPTISPATVTIRLPQASAERMPGWVYAAATPDLESLSRLDPDQPRAVRAKVRITDLPPDVGPVTITPPEVQITLKLRGQSDTLVVPQAPVWVVLPSGEADRWEVKVADPFVRNVTVTGPREQIAALRADPSGVRALLLLSSGDLQKGPTSAKVTFSAGPTTLQYQCDQPEVKFAIRKR